MARLSIIIPAHNEALRIKPTLDEYCHHFRESGEIVVVCNGCTDNTAGVVRERQRHFKNLSLLESRGRWGKGAAICEGVRSRSEEWVGYTDADGATPASEFDRLFRLARTQSADGAIGSRWLTGAILEIPPPLTRRLASRAFNGIVRALLQLPYADTQCGAKVFRRSAIKDIVCKITTVDFAFDIDLLVRLRDAGCHVCEIPMRWRDVSAGSKVRLLSAAPLMLWRVLEMASRRNPRFARMNFDSVADLQSIQEPTHR